MRELDYRSLLFLVERSDSSRFQKDRERRKLEKAYRVGRLHLPENEPQQHRWYRCEARFYMGDYSDWSGWEFRDNWATSNWFVNGGNLPVWKGGYVGKLYVVGEQGLGDEVLFAQSLLEVVKEVGEVVFETQPRLVPVFNRAFPVEAVGCELIPHPSGDGELRIKKEMWGDAWVTLGELCRVYLKRGFRRVPYLTADPAQVERFNAYKGRVGISWRGRQGGEKRIISAFPGAVSLQYGMTWEEGVETPEGLDLRDDIEGILGLLANLSEVVTVSTSVAHFASAMGVPTTVILAPKGTGVGNMIPWKWHADNLPNLTWWYPDSTRTYDGWDSYCRARKIGLTERVGAADRQAYRRQDEKPGLAATEPA